MLVVDASVLAVALLDDGQEGDALRARLRGEDLAAPSLVDLEIVSVWRGLVHGRPLDPRRVSSALEDLRALPLQRVDHGTLLLRCWELRQTLTVYDASYVALAEALNATLLTGDQRIARAPGPTCPIEIVEPSSRPR